MEGVIVGDGAGLVREVLAPADWVHTTEKQVIYVNTFGCLSEVKVFICVKFLVVQPRHKAAHNGSMNTEKNEMLYVICSYLESLSSWVTGSLHQEVSDSNHM